MPRSVITWGYWEGQKDPVPLPSPDLGKLSSTNHNTLPRPSPLPPK